MQSKVFAYSDIKRLWSRNLSSCRRLLPEFHLAVVRPEVAHVSLGKTKKDEGIRDLLICSLLWGTYNPVMKVIYADDHPLDASTLTAIRTFLAAAALGAAVASDRFKSTNSRGSVPSAEAGGMDQHSRAQATPDATIVDADDDTPGHFDPLLVSRAITSTDASIISEAAPFSAGKSESHGLAFLSMASSSVFVAGIELGLYNFGGTALQALGLQLTSATRAGFVIQSTALLTPAIAYLAGQRISNQVWAAVSIGVLGSCLIAYDSLSANDSTSATGPAELQGMSLLLLACVFYSLAIVRLGIYAPRFSSVDLAAVKKLTLCLASFAWFTTQQHDASGGSLDEQLISSGITEKTIGSWFVVAYSALGPGALATYLQTKGQATVPAPQAQVIYSLAPVWSAVIAQITLGGETMGSLSWLGGLAILSASILASKESWEIGR